MTLEARVDRIEDALVRLVAAQARTETNLNNLTVEITELAAQTRALAEAQTRTEQAIGQLAARVDQLAVRVDELAVGLQTLTARVDQLAVRVDELAVGLQTLTARVDQLAVRVDELAVGLQTLTARVDQLAAQVEQLAGAQLHADARLKALEASWRGELGRREGERYEAETLRSAGLILGAGWGGSPAEPDVRAWLWQVLAGRELPPAENPLLADIIWRKDGLIAVVEVSAAVSIEDIERAHARSRVLTEAGLQAVPIVVGRRWASARAREAARTRNVEWRVGQELSAGYQKFRSHPASARP
jgi:outer membrane murein-binding lipoprotein Lpp